MYTLTSRVTELQVSPADAEDRTRPVHESERSMWSGVATRVIEFLCLSRNENVKRETVVIRVAGGEKRAGVSPSDLVRALIMMKLSAKAAIHTTPWTPASDSRPPATSSDCGGGRRSRAEMVPTYNDDRSSQLLWYLLLSVSEMPMKPFNTPYLRQPVPVCGPWALFVFC
ncbi:hypothetical protein J6590_012527 [Homalodisca vitripennis]|nr:hypothetical protein J6590_012527 [Homalodisca vitripennis]